MNAMDMQLSGAKSAPTGWLFCPVDWLQEPPRAPECGGVGMDGVS
jgi:hypothetical protein